MKAKWFRPRIRLNHAEQRPQLLLFLDVASQVVWNERNENSRRHVLNLWQSNYLELRQGNIRTQTYQGGLDVQSFWDTLENHCQPKKTLYMFSLGSAIPTTLLNVWKQLENGPWRLYLPKEQYAIHSKAKDPQEWEALFVSEDPPTIIEARHEAKPFRWVWCDIRNWFDWPIEAIEKSLGMPHVERPPQSLIEDAAIAWTAHRVSCIKQLMLQWIAFCDLHNVGNWRYTMAGQSYAAWRHRFMQDDVYPHGHEHAKQIEASSLFGGLCQLYFHGEVITDARPYSKRVPLFYDYASNLRRGPIHVYDVNSLYPFVMARDKMPIRMIGCQVNPRKEGIIDFIKSHNCAAELSIDSEYDSYPKRDKTCVFNARGKFRTALCGRELQRAANEGHINEVYAISWYETADIFSQFTEYFYRLKKEYSLSENEIWRKACKIFLNGLPGKFAQREGRWLWYGDYLPEMPWGIETRENAETGEIDTYRIIADNPQRLSDKRFSEHSCPIITGFICAAAREYMRDLTKQLVHCEVLYTDCDSLHMIGRAGLEPIIPRELIGDEIGQLRREYVAQTAEYRGIKYYHLDGEWVIAGIKADAQRIKDDVWMQTQWSSLHGILASREQHFINVKDIKVTRELQDYYGTKHASGQVTEPVLEEY